MIRSTFAPPNRIRHHENKNKPEKYFLVESPSTPLFFLSSTAKYMLIKGKCNPLEPNDFFNRVNEFLDLFQQNGHQLQNVTFYFNYIDIGSSKYILKLLQRIVRNDFPQKSTDISWFYDEDNPDVLLAGKNMAEYSHTHMNFICFG